MRMRLLFSVLIAAVVSTPVLGQHTSRTLQHDGLNRAYTLYIPDGYVDGEFYPLVINMHGLTSNSNQQISLSKMHEVADREEFLVAYPDAINGDWINGENNVGFINDIIDYVGESHGVDESRVYATGMSQGGVMSYILAAELTDRIAAIAPVSGVLLTEPRSTEPAHTVVPSRPMPLLHIHGTSDTLIPYNGGRSQLPALDNLLNGHEFPPVMEVMGLWSQNNQCVGNFTTNDLPDTATNDNSTVAEINNQDCATYVDQQGNSQVAEVIHFRVNGGGHTWPGGQPSAFGATNRDIDASQEIWDFFSRHTLPHRSIVANCDLNADALCTFADVDMLIAAIAEGSGDTQFDLNGDDSVNRGDLSEWLSIAATENGYAEPYLFGDGDLNGTVGASDLNALALNWRGSTNKWSDGDFNADGMVDSTDLNTLALGWRDSISAAAAPVPEPAMGVWLVFLVTSFAFVRRVSVRRGALQLARR